LSNWHKIELGEVGNIITGKTPPTKDKDNYGNEYMFIGPTDLHKHFILKSSEKMISKKGLDTIKGSILEGTSILVGCIGWDMGNVAIITKKCATNQQINSITNIKKEYNPLFIYYWLKNKKDFLFSIANVTRTPILNKTDFSKIAINVPTKNYQDKIVSILSSLDKKIELNNQINQKLEAMAKILYDYWFVQFDFPNADGKPYKSSGGKMVYSEELKREIPEGWEVEELGNVADIIAGGDKPKEFSKKENKKFTIPIFSNGIQNEGLYGFTDKARIIKPSITISARGTIGYCVLRNQPFVPIIRLIAVTPKIDGSSVFFYHSIKNLVFENSGSVQQQLTVPQISSLNIVFPAATILEEFEKITSPSIVKIENIKKENKELIALRDWLLPMLMNGQVKVADATEMVDELMVAEPSVGYGKSN